jgi:hypothetical protein
MKATNFKPHSALKVENSTGLLRRSYDTHETFFPFIRHQIPSLEMTKYRVIQNDCRGFNNLSYTKHLRYEYMCFLFNRTTLQVFVTCLTGALYVHPL